MKTVEREDSEITSLLLVYRRGEQVWGGMTHPWVFREEEHDMSSLYGAFAEL